MSSARAESALPDSSSAWLAPSTKRSVELSPIIPGVTRSHMASISGSMCWMLFTSKPFASFPARER